MESTDSGKVGHVSISIRDEENQAPPAPGRPQLKFYFGVMYVLALLFMVLLMLAAMFQNKMQSTFKTRGGLFIIMAIVSVSVAILASAILIFTSHCLQSLMRDIHYTIFKCIGYFSATTASFCLVVVLFVPLDLNPWIAYPLICILFAAYDFACYRLWKHLCPLLLEDDKLHVHPPAVLFLIPLLLIALFGSVSHGLHWIRYMVLCLNLTILAASCFVIAYMTFFYGRNKQLIGTTSSSSTDPTRQPDTHQSSSTIISLAT